MLMLSRKDRQAIIIGDDIRLTVVRIWSRAVRIKIQSPIRIGLSLPATSNLSPRRNAEWHDPPGEQGLVVTRAFNEWIFMGDDIGAKVVEVEAGFRVRLGFEAPVEISVHRQEVYEAIQQEIGQARRSPQQAHVDSLRNPPPARTLRDVPVGIRMPGALARRVRAYR